MPRAIRDFSPIYTTEQVILSFDFSAALATGETLLTTASPTVSPAVSIALVSGADATPTARLIGGPVVIGTAVVQMVGSLQPGTVYDIIATVATSTGEILTVNSHQACPPIQ